MKLKKRIIAAVLSAVFILCSVSLPVAAAVANPFTWDGSSALVSGRNYYISDSVTLDGSFTVPEDTLLTVLSGGSITIPREMALTQKGNIVIENGASLIISGALNLDSGSSLCIEGTLSSGSGSVLSAFGKVLLSDTSQTALTGVSTINSDFDCYGKLSLSGTVNINTDAQINGTFTVESGGTVTNTGLLTLSENCKYALYGVFKNNGGGAVNDLRPQYDVSALSVDTMSLYTTDALTGIDVSYAQGEIDWGKVKESGIDFAMIRSSRGRISDENPMTSDTYFHQNAKGAMQNDIPIGVYHYCYAETVEQARDEARFVLSLIDSYDISYPVVFDIEDEWFIRNGYSKETLTAMTEAFCDEIKAAGYIPVVYSYASFLYYHLDMSALSQYPVWVANVDVDKPDYDGAYFLWQYSWKGSISGINGDVDMDYSYIDFAAYTKKFGLNNQK